MGIFEDLAENRVLEHHYGGSRSFFDHSGNGNHGVPSGCFFTGDSLAMDSGYVQVDDSPELQLTAGCIVAFGDFTSHDNGERVVSKQDAGGTNYSLTFVGPPNKLNFYDGVNNRNVVADVIGKTCVAVNFESGQKCEGFIEGMSVGLFNDISTITIDDAPLRIGNYYTGGFPLKSRLKSVLIFNKKLTPDEHLDVYNKLTGMQWPTAIQQKLKDPNPNEVLDGDMEDESTIFWAVGNSADLQKVSSSLSGKALSIGYGGSNFPNAKQLILETGIEYRLTGYARGNGTANPYIYTGSTIWTGTASSEWQEIDVTFTPTIVDLRLYGDNKGGDNWVEFDNVTVAEVDKIYPCLYTGKYGAFQSISNVTSGNLENTPCVVESGAYKIVTENVSGTRAKVIECVTAGRLSIFNGLLGQNQKDSAYDNFELWVKRASAGSTMNILFIANSTGTLSTAGQYAYAAEYASTGRIRLLRSLNGAAAALNSTATDFTDSGEWHKLKTKREKGTSKIYLYWDDTLIVMSAGINPVIDANVSTSKYTVLEMSAGDKVIWATEETKKAFKRHLREC